MKPPPPNGCDTYHDFDSGDVYRYDGTWSSPSRFCTSPCCVSAVASLPAGAAKVGHDCASKCFYAITATAKDAAGNTLSFDKTREIWGYISWTDWATSVAGGSAGTITPWSLNPRWQPVTVTGLLDVNGSAITVAADVVGRPGAGFDVMPNTDPQYQAMITDNRL